MGARTPISVMSRKKPDKSNSPVPGTIRLWPVS